MITSDELIEKIVDEIEKLGIDVKFADLVGAGAYVSYKHGAAIIDPYQTTPFGVCHEYFHAKYKDSLRCSEYDWNNPCERRADREAILYLWRRFVEAGGTINEKLTNHDSQLFRYFGTTTSKFGLLTNGREYRFYTDLDEQNKMDSTPFLTIDITNIKDNQFIELAKFHKENFDVDKITSSAAELKYLNSLKLFLSDNLTEPTESFIAYLVSQIYDGIKTKSTLEKFSPIIKKGLNQFVTERVNEKLSAALNTNVETKIVEETEELPEPNHDDGIITTPEELEAFTVFRVTSKDFIDPSRLYYRDTKSYFGILIDDTIRKWVFRFYQKATKNLIEIRDCGTFEIETPLDIALYQEQIQQVIENYK